MVATGINENSSLASSPELQRPPPDKKLKRRPPYATIEISDDKLLHLRLEVDASFRYDNDGEEDGNNIPLTASEATSLLLPNASTL
jgi:hypothetical protein